MSVKKAKGKGKGTTTEKPAKPKEKATAKEQAAPKKEGKDVAEVRESINELVKESAEAIAIS